MKLEDVINNVEELDGLTQKQITAIIKIIDLKTEDDMDKALQKMENLSNNNLKWTIATIIGLGGLIIAIITAIAKMA